MPLILICVLIFGAWFTYQYKHNLLKNDNASEEFWKKEQEANFTRRRSTEDIEYLNISVEDIPPCPEAAGTEAAGIHAELLELIKKPCVDLSDYTNTELKLKYGAPNFEALSEADSNYILLVRKLTSYGLKLAESDNTDELRLVYKLADRIGADTAELTLAAARSFIPEGNTSAIEGIIEKCERRSRSSKLLGELREILTQCINGDDPSSPDSVTEEISGILDELEKKQP